MTIVVVKVTSEKEIILLTNLPVGKEISFYTPEKILEIYLTRWKCDENYRFLKNAYNSEDIRLRNYNSINNMVTLLLAVFYMCIFS